VERLGSRDLLSSRYVAVHVRRQETDGIWRLCPLCLSLSPRLCCCVCRAGGTVKSCSAWQSSWPIRDRIDQEPFIRDITGEDGKQYQIEICFFWDGKPDGDIRVIGAIHDGSWFRSFVPLSLDFIKGTQRPEQ